MLKTLVKKQLMEIFRSYFYNAKTNKKRSTAGIIAYILLFAALMIGLGGMFTGLSVSLCAPLTQAGMSWLYFALMSLLAIFLGAFGSVFNTYAGLYAAKDNDLLLSLPIPVRTLMASRLLGVYLMGLMYAAVVIVPAVIVYWMRVSAAPMTILGGVLLTVLISAFVLTLSCALGWLVAKVSRKLKRKNFITVIVSLAGIAVYYFFVFKAQTALEALVANAALYGEKIKGAAHPLYLVGCVGTGDGRAMLLVSLIVAALFALMWALLAHSFLKLSTATGASERAVYRERTLKRQSADAALFQKELARFTASPNYMLNCGLGILLLPVAGVALVIKGGELLPLLQMAFGDRGGCVEVLLCTGVCTIAAMNDMAAPSVSLEGKNLWLAQSLPVTPWQVLRAQERACRDAAMASMKADGIDYDERIERLQEVTYPKPLEDLLWPAFHTYCESVPWANDYRLSPKSVLRDMLETASDFKGYIARYGISRSEGTLLRYLSDAYRVLDRTLPPDKRNDELDQIVEWLGFVVRTTDSSLLDEWAGLDSDDAGMDAAPPQDADVVVKDRKAVSCETRCSRASGCSPPRRRASWESSTRSGAGASHVGVRLWSAFSTSTRKCCSTATRARAGT